MAFVFVCFVSYWHSPYCRALLIRIRQNEVVYLCELIAMFDFIHVNPYGHKNLLGWEDGESM